MKGFAQIVAPFDGVVTKRTADIGALVNAGPASNGDPLFAVSDVHALRALCECAAILFGRDSARHDGVPDGAGISGQDLSGEAGLDLRRDQRPILDSLLVEFEADNRGRSAQAGRLCPGQHDTAEQAGYACACRPAP